MLMSKALRWVTFWTVGLLALGGYFLFAGLPSTLAPILGDQAAKVQTSPEARKAGQAAKAAAGRAADRVSQLATGGPEIQTPPRSRSQQGGLFGGPSSTSATPRTVSTPSRTAPAAAPRAVAKKTTPAAPEAEKSALTKAREAVIGWVLLGVRVLLLLTLIGLIIFVVPRTIARRLRKVVRYKVALPRADSPEFERVVSLIESWHRLLQREEWWKRLLCGQPHMALELHSIPVSGTKAHEVVGAIVCPPELAPEIDQRLSAAYPNARLGYDFSPPPEAWAQAITWRRRAVRLYKERRNILRSITPREDVSLQIAEEALTAAASRMSPVSIQIRLMPTSRLAEHRFLRRLRAHERKYEFEHHLGGPGLSAQPLARREVEAASGHGWRSLFYGEVWVFGQEDKQVRSVAATLQAATGENPLQRRRPWSPLHRRRITTGIPGLLSTSTFAAPEIAALWSLPGAEAPLPSPRATIPRLPTPPSVLHVRRSQALAEIMGGYMALRPQELPLNIGVVGLNGAGKTTFLGAIVRNASQDPNAACFVFDPKSDLVLEAMRAIDPGLKRVWILDCARPEFGINPLNQPADMEARAEAFVSAMQDANEEGAIQESSARFLKMGAMAGMVLAEASGKAATLWDVIAILEPENGGLRERASQLCQGRKELDSVRAFMDHFRQHLSKAQAMFTSKVEAPANKIQRFLIHQTNQVLHHDFSISIREIVDRREVLVVNGAMGSLGTDTSSKLLKMFLRLVLTELQRRQEEGTRRRQRGEQVVMPRVVVVADEAHYLVTEGFAKLLATGRSAGLELVAAWQFGAQFSEPEVRGAIDDLLQHRVIFRCGQEDARVATSLLMTSYSDRISDDPRARERMRVAPDVFVALPQYVGVMTVVAQNQRTLPFTIRTIPGGPRQENVDRHVRRQSRTKRKDGSGPHYPPVLPDPPLAGGGADHEEAVPSTEVGGASTGFRRANEAQTPVPATDMMLGVLGEGSAPTAEEVTLEPDEVVPPPEPASQPERDIIDAEAVAVDSDSGSEAPSEEEAISSTAVVGDARIEAADSTSAEATEEREDGDGAPEPEAHSRPASSNEGPLRGAHFNVPRSGYASRRTPQGTDLTYNWAEAQREAPKIEQQRADKRELAERQAEFAVEQKRRHDRRRPRPFVDGFVSETYSELQIDRAGQVEWVPADTATPADKIPALMGPLELDIARLLFRFDIVYGTQIADNVSHPSERTLQRKMKQMVEHGWLRRGRFHNLEPGKTPYFYALTQSGFDAALATREAVGQDVSVARRHWTPSNKGSVPTVLGMLHLVGWATAASKVIGSPGVVQVLGDRNQSRTRLAPPRERGQALRLMDLRTSNQFWYGHDSATYRVSRGINADGYLELELPDPKEPSKLVRIDYFIEVERRARPDRNRMEEETKFTAYDMLIGAWCGRVPRFAEIGRRPRVIFVMNDEQALRAWMNKADVEMRLGIDLLGRDKSRFTFPGRAGTYFVMERDIHEGSLRAWKLPQRPPALRKELGDAEAMVPEETRLVSDEVMALLRRGARAA